MNSFYKGFTLLCAAGLVIWGLVAGLRYIYEAGEWSAEYDWKIKVDQRDSTIKEKQAELDKVWKERKDAVEALAVANAAKTELDGLTTRITAEHGAFLETTLALRDIAERPEANLELGGLYKPQKCGLKFDWNARTGISFSKEGLQVKEQKFQFVRAADGAITNIEFKVEKVRAGTTTGSLGLDHNDNF